METRVDAYVLWARALVVGSLAFFLGVVGHVTADGLLPGPAFLAALLALSVLLSAPMLSRPASSVRLVAMLVGGQTVLHLVLSLSAGHAGDRATSAGAAPSRAVGNLPVLDGRRVGSLQDAYTGASGQHGGLAPALPVGHLIDDLSAHAPMMVVHLAAAALVALWLTYGEKALLAVLAITARLVVALIPSAPPVVRRPATLRASLTELRVGALADLLLSRAVSRRGPPLLAA